MKIMFFLLCCLCSTALFGQGIPATDNFVLEALQSIHDEARPVIATDGKTLYFSRKGHPQNMGDEDQYDIWIALRKNEDVWGKPIHMTLPINNKADNYVVSTSADGQEIFLWDGNQESGSELVYTKKKGRSWMDPAPVQIQNFIPTSPVSYSMADDNQILLLSVDQANGNGGRDIYVSTKIEEGIWSELINLGGIINSENEETHAFLAADNKTLYFLSNGFGNPDLMTLMVSHRKESSSWTDWSAPIATGIALEPSLFNTAFSISAIGQRMYIDGKATPESDQQLFVIPIPDQHQPEPVALITGTLIHADTGFELDGNVMLESLGSFEDSQTQKTTRGGRFQFVLPKDANFNLSATVPGYFAQSEIIANQSLQELDKEETDLDSNQELSISPEVDHLNVRLQQLNKSLQELERRRATTHEEMGKRQRINWSPNRTDTKYVALELKYQEALGLETVENEEIISTGDSELDAMKRTFRKYNDGKERIAESNNKATTPKGESQLDAMKRKFNEVNGSSEDQIDNNENTNTTKEPEEESVVLSAVTLGYSSFAEWVAQSHAELEEELNERVVKELRADLLQEVSFKMHASMDSDSRNQYAGKLQRKTALLESEARKELRKKNKNQAKKELRGELLEEVKAELRELLREEVKKELREELEDEVRKELQLELEYLLTKEMAADLQKELNTLVKQSKKTTVSSPANYYGGSIDPNAKRKTVNKAQLEINIEMYPLKKGRIIPLYNVFFEANSDQWKDYALPELNRLYDLLIAHPNLKIEIGAHSNGWCSAAFSNSLTTSRAKATADFLVKRGIAPDRLAWKGYGKTQPLVPNDSVENCKRNQRLELRVLSNE